VALTAGGRAAILLVGPLGLEDTSPIVVGLTIHISDPPNLDLGLGCLSWTGQILLLVFTWAVNPESRSKRGIKHHGKCVSFGSWVGWMRVVKSGLKVELISGRVMTLG
jgi:hypothetical protein